MYFKDLTPYCYHSRHSGGEPVKNVLNIGWLDEEHPFPTGGVPERILTRVLALCVFDLVNRTLGYHVSAFLKDPPIGYPVEYRGRRQLLGSAEIRVPGREGKIYAAPNLIYHYMKDCGYLPPQEFLDAVDSLPPLETPSDEDYEIYSIALSKVYPAKEGESIVFREETKSASLVPAERDKPHIDDDEPWMDADLMHKDFMGGALRRRVLTGEDPTKVVSVEFPEIARETLEDFVERNQIPAILESRLRLDVTQEPLSKEQERLFWGKNSVDEGWIMFQHNYPNAAGYFSFSRVGFNVSRTEALVEIGVWQASLVGRGVLMFLAKASEGTWAVKKELLVWMS